MIAETNPHKTKLALQTSQDPGVMVKSFDHQEPKLGCRAYLPSCITCPSHVIPAISPNPSSNPIRQERPIQALLTIDKTKTEMWGNLPELISRRVEVRIKVS